MYKFFLEFRAWRNRSMETNLHSLHEDKVFSISNHSNSNSSTRRYNPKLRGMIGQLNYVSSHTKRSGQQYTSEIINVIDLIMPKKSQGLFAPTDIDYKKQVKHDAFSIKQPEFVMIRYATNFICTVSRTNQKLTILTLKCQFRIRHKNS